MWSAGGAGNLLGECEARAVMGEAAVWQMVPEALVLGRLIERQQL